jgi:hypothetical protein
MTDRSPASSGDRSCPLHKCETPEVQPGSHAGNWNGTDASPDQPCPNASPRGFFLAPPRPGVTIAHVSRVTHVISNSGRSVGCVATK